MQACMMHCTSQLYSTLVIHSQVSNTNAEGTYACTVEQNINIYLYEQEEEHDWLLTLHRMCNFVVIDIDNSPSLTRDAISYFISFPNTFWLTNGDNVYYNKISNNRIYNLDWIGGKLEKTT